MIISLNKLQEYQLELDKVINKAHNTSYETTRDERLLALLVELSELANATRTFKYWSLKGSESKERVLDEFADGLHFLLSLTLAYDVTLDEFHVEKEEGISLNEMFLKTYDAINRFYVDRSEDSLLLAFKTYLSLGIALKFSKEDIINGYLKKISVNYKRQEEGY